MTDRFAINLHKKYTMNIFDLYSDKIKEVIKILNKEGLIKLPEKLDSINVDIPPSNFNCDISSNVAMVLSKINKKNPLIIANELSKFIKDKDKNIEDISVANPGFINIKFKSTYWNEFVKEINLNYKEFGINKKVKNKSI